LAATRIKYDLTWHRSSRLSQLKLLETNPATATCTEKSNLNLIFSTTRGYSDYYIRICIVVFSAQEFCISEILHSDFQHLHIIVISSNGSISWICSNVCDSFGHDLDSAVEYRLLLIYVTGSGKTRRKSQMIKQQKLA